jgi:hypothetical protein
VPRVTVMGFLFFQHAVWGQLLLLFEFRTLSDLKVQ